MARFAISQEGADALRQLADDLRTSSENIIQASLTLQNKIMDCMDDLGGLGPDIWNLTLQVKAMLEDKSEIIGELSERLLQQSDEIMALAGGMTEENGIIEDTS